MQVGSPSSPPAKYSSDAGRLREDLEEGEGKIRKLERSWSKLEESVEFDEEDEEEEFSFACLNAQGSPITADEAFEGGQIRPVFPLFNRNDGASVADVDDNPRPRLRKLFVEEDGETELEPSGPFCSWSGGTVEEASPETCRKSNSTGFSKLWRFRDLVLRSNSDGRDAFVFLNDKTHSSSSSSTSTHDDKKKLTEDSTTKTIKGKDKTRASEKKPKSAHEKLYMRNRAMREEGKHRSYLPYKQVGFFTNVNGLSRNVHPF